MGAEVECRAFPCIQCTGFMQDPRHVIRAPEFRCRHGSQVRPQHPDATGESCDVSSLLRIREACNEVHAHGGHVRSDPARIEAASRPLHALQEGTLTGIRVEVRACECVIAHHGAA